MAPPPQDWEDEAIWEIGDWDQPTALDKVEDAFKEVSILKRDRKTVSFAPPVGKKRARTMSQDEHETMAPRGIPSLPRCASLPAGKFTGTTGFRASASATTAPVPILGPGSATIVDATPTSTKTGPSGSLGAPRECQPMASSISPPSRRDAFSPALRERSSQSMRAPPHKAVGFSLDETMLSLTERMKGAFGGSTAQGGKTLDSSSPGCASASPPATAPAGGTVPGSVFLSVHARSGELGLTPLMKAARAGNCELISSLLKHGAEPADTDKRGFDALMYAVRDGYSRAAELLLRALRSRAAKAGGRGYTFRNKHRLSHILYASLNGHTMCVEVLARFGSRLDICDSTGFTPLMGAAQNGHAETLRRLIDLGCSLDLQDRNGLTALAWAVHAGSEDAVRILVEAGANVSQGDRFGRPPLLLAVLEGRTSIGELLLKNGATVCDKVRVAVLQMHMRKAEAAKAPSPTAEDPTAA